MSPELPLPESTRFNAALDLRRAIAERALHIYRRALRLRTITLTLVSFASLLQAGLILWPGFGASWLADNQMLVSFLLVTVSLLMIGNAWSCRVSADRSIAYFTGYYRRTLAQNRAA